MNDQQQMDIARDLQAFLVETRSTGPELEQGIAQFVTVLRETAFRAGWGAGQKWQEHRDAQAFTARGSAPSTVRVLVDVGDRAWVQPLAIIEHTGTGELFIDPRFTISEEPSDHCCIELVVTHEGLVASGPTDRHRLSPELDRDRLRPLLRFEALGVG